MDKPFLKMNHHQRFSLSISKTTQIVFAEASPKHCAVSHLCIPRDSNCQRTCIYHHLFFRIAYSVVLPTRFKSPYSSTLSLHSSTLSIPLILYPYTPAYRPSHASILRNSLIRVMKLYVDNHTVNIQDFIL
jgi:hypothetical protein